MTAMKPTQVVTWQSRRYQALRSSSVAPQEKEADDDDRQHQEGDAHHDAEGEIDDGNRRALVRGKILETFDRAVPGMGR